MRTAVAPHELRPIGAVFFDNNPISTSSYRYCGNRADFGMQFNTNNPLIVNSVPPAVTDVLGKGGYTWFGNPFLPRSHESSGFAAVLCRRKSS